MKKVTKFLLSLCTFVLVISGAMLLTACSPTQEKEITEIVVLNQLNLTKVYDGKPVEEPFIYSILADEEFEYTIDWFSGDTKLEESPVNAGNYKILITINYGDKTQTLEKEFEIEKCKVEKPQAPSLTYTGETQYPFKDIDKNIIGVSGEGASGFDGIVAPNLSNNKTTFSLKDKTNYEWQDGTTDDFTVTWNWNKKICSAQISIEKEYDGTATEAIELTSDHGLFACDLNKGLYVIANFNSSEVDSTVCSYYIAIKNGDAYEKLRGYSYDENGNLNYTENVGAGLKYFYNYNFVFNVGGKIV